MANVEDEPTPARAGGGTDARTRTGASDEST